MEATLIAPSTLTTSTKRLWIGRVLSGLAVVFLTFDGAMKLVQHPEVIKGTVKLGFPVASIVPIGLVLLACVALYLIPRTAIIGAVLLTGYLGGAVATHVRIADPVLSHVLFPTYVAALAWSGLYLRDSRVGRLLSAVRA